MINYDDVYRIGRITKAHGLKGEMVFEFDDDVFDRTDSDYLICEVDRILVPFFIEEYRFRSDSSALIKFEDIDTLEQTTQITGSNVYFERKLTVPAENDSDDEEELSLYYFIGFNIIVDGKDIGKIEVIDDSTQNYLFILDTGVLIPASDDFVLDIDYKGMTITMSLPEGLLDLNN